MTHFTEDEFLGYALRTLSEEELCSIASHLEACSQCRLLFEKMEDEIEVLAGVKPDVSSLPPPLPRPSRRLDGHGPSLSSLRQAFSHSALRIAALIALGILVGFGVSKKMSREPEFFSPAYVTLSPPSDSLVPYTVSDGTSVSPVYYEQLREDRK